MALAILKNLVRSLAVLIVVTFATFALMFGDGHGIAFATLGISASEADVQRQIVALGLDRPLPAQYLDWVGGVLTGDLGRSFYTSESVVSALTNRVPLTITIVLVAIVLTAVFSVVLGTLAAVRGGWVDRFVQFFSVLGTAIPAYIIAIALVFTLAVNYRVFPATGYVQLSQGVIPWAHSITLPVLALVIGSIAGATQQFRTAVLDTLGRDFVRTLRARGVAERSVIMRHVLRNSAAPGLTVISMTTFSLLGGAVFIETVFAMAGMGQLAVQSATKNDVPMVMGTVLVTTIIVLTVNFLADLGVMLLNPKSRAK
jgi:peptide/nickel transport system permease protein